VLALADAGVQKLTRPFHAGVGVHNGNRPAFRGYLLGNTAAHVAAADNAYTLYTV
jgi:hypothetical protein